MPPSLRKAVAAAIGGGAIAIASVLITGPSGNDGLEGVSYIPYKDIVGVWTVCHGHTGKDIMLGKTYTHSLSGTAASAGAHAHTVGIGAHTHSVAIGSHGHTITVNAAGNAENTVKNIAFNYIVRLA